MSTPYDMKKRLEHYSAFTGIFTIGVGLLVVVGWLFNIGTLKSILPNLVEMKFNTALLYIATGLSLLLVQKKSSPWMIYLLSGGGILVAALTGLQDILPVDFGIDQFFIQEPVDAIYTVSPGRMSLLTAISFIVLNIALLCHLSKRTKELYLIEIAAVLSALLSYFNIIGYLLSIKFLTVLNLKMTSMALNTAILFFFLGPAVLFLHSDRQVVELVCSPKISGKIIRRLLPFAIVVSASLNFMHVYIVRSGILPQDIANSFYIILNIIYVCIFFAILIYDLVRAEQQQQRSEEELEILFVREKKALIEAENANRAKDLFLATLSHELRTPLTAILGWAQLIAGGSLDREKTKQAAAIIQQSARTQGQLINDLLDISRIIMGKFALEKKFIAPSSFIQAAIDAVSPMAEAKAIEINTQLAEMTETILGDPVRLQQAIWNLLTNAIKFSGEKSKIEVRSHIIKHSEGRSVRIEVVDHGQGISPEFMPLLFESFSQADSSSIRKHGGLGLGLSIVKSIVELHGGTVTVESPGVGKGATFTITLPLQDNVQVPFSFAYRSDFDVKLTGIRVLLVDDDVPTCQALKAFLKSLEAEVTSASSAVEALKIFSKIKPHILVSDIAMPGEDGYSLIKKIRALPDAEGGNIPAIAITAFAGADDVKLAHLAGFQIHLAKPVDGDRLATEIFKFLRQNLLTNNKTAS
ncbi:MAG: hypothetical protein A2X86_09375 [Bdellovibrionales bacterium GWA2_49_15]|nr:MAG: hypothetical protein A2X86_09375 [Bdellovibrionales bacterium GWA2_49_15]HAZ12990.1 hypothetical protein [Bdellovibrionales bacterium]